ncbi:hypothetical protein D3C73_749590 [compost metagenome]
MREEVFLLLFCFGTAKRRNALQAIAACISFELEILSSLGLEVVMAQQHLGEVNLILLQHLLTQHRQQVAGEHAEPLQ